MSGAAEPVKIVFWDLDGTLWDGTLEEDKEGALAPRPQVVAALRTLDARGILHSLVTQAAAPAALSQLQASGLVAYFVRPTYGAGSKAQAIAAALTDLHLLPANAAFVDDEPFHRAEVAALLPAVLIVPAAAASLLPEHPRCQVASALGTKRREMMQVEEARVRAEQTFAGSRADFLRSCGMTLRCRAALDNDMPRIEELLTRAHRLASSPGQVTVEAGLPDSSLAPATRYYCGRLSDRFGDYGVVAVAGVQERPLPHRSAIAAPVCTRFAISCRTQGRGVVESFLRWLVETVGPDLHMLVATASSVNQPLRAALRLCGFAAAASGAGWEMAALVRPERLAVPAWISVKGEDGGGE